MRDPVALITGGAGFVGTHLRILLGDVGHQVYTYDLKSGYDVRDYEHLRTLVDTLQPDYIYHLAAQAYVAESVGDPGRAMSVNTLGTLNLLEACRAVGCHAKILVTGTSEEYGYDQQPGPTITEESPNHPATPYGVSKLAATTLAMTYVRNHGMHVVATRAWNHTGPGRPPVYADSAFAKRIARATQTGEPVRHGNLDAIRNYSDVRDIADAYIRVIGADPGIYNIATPGQSVTMRDLLLTLVTQTGSTVRLEQDPSLWRPSNSDTWYEPDISKIQEATGWEPTIPLERTLADLLNDWMDR